MTTPRITFCIATTLVAGLIATAARVPTTDAVNIVETDASTGHSAFLSQDCNRNLTSVSLT